MGRYQTLFKNTSFIMIGGALSKVISFIMLPLYTLWLNPSDYGLSDIISIYASLLVSIATLGIAEAMFVFPKGAETEDQKKYFSSSIIYQ